MTVTTGARATKYDPYLSCCPVGIDHVEVDQSIDLRYDISQLKDIAQIERIKSDCVEIEYPLDNVSELDHLKFIESQFAAYNTVDIDRKSVDKTIFELIPHFLGHEGVQLPDSPDLAARAKALIFKQVCDINSTERTITYLNNCSYLSQMFESSAACLTVSQSTYSKTRDEFGLSRESVQDAIRRLRHFLFRNGLLLDEISDSCYIEGQEIPQGNNIPDDLRYQALINWSDLLLRQVTKEISFNRGDNTTYSVREILAAIAKMALDKNISKAHNLARLQYGDDFISPEQINNIISENLAQETFLLSKQEIERIGTEMNRNLLAFAADELGFFDQPLDIAIDPTWVSIDKDTDPETVSGAMGNYRLEGDGGFFFATGVSFTPMSRFSLGVNLVTDKSTLPNAFRRMLLVLKEFTEIGWILADREFDNPETIELFRTAAGETWAIRLRSHKDIIDMNQYRQLRQEGKATLSFGGTQVNAFWTDIADSALDWVFERESDELIIMSGIPLNETTISYLSSIYSSRWSAETLIREIKNDFSPEIPRWNALEYLFFLNISSIFYNMYKIINQSISPMYGLPLRPTCYEVLWGLVHSTFQYRCPDN